jgi:molybdopterin biosynthesis enzyme
MAFIQLVIPALRKMAGDDPALFPFASARLAAGVTGHKKWTDFIHARLESHDDQLWVYPARLKSGLQSMARKEALIIIPEDREKLTVGEVIPIQLLTLSS